MMPWSGLLSTPIEHANEMGTSELHRTRIMLAATAPTTDRSMHPGRSQAKAKGKQDGSRKSEDQTRP